MNANNINTILLILIFSLVVSFIVMNKSPLKGEKQQPIIINNYYYNSNVTINNTDIQHNKSDAQHNKLQQETID